ncbi:MAG: hypothetical protein ABIB47_04395 [Candidatus Woesearchaeota archaeon]
MKKLLSILLVIGFIVISGCNKSQTTAGPLTISDCDVKESEISKYICISEVAKLKIDETICNNIEHKGKGIQDNCFMQVAIAKKDERICQKIKNNDLENKDQCLSAVAIQKNEKSICNKIEITRIKTLCIDKVTRLGGNI